MVLLRKKRLELYMKKGWVKLSNPYQGNKKRDIRPNFVQKDLTNKLKKRQISYAYARSLTVTNKYVSRTNMKKGITHNNFFRFINRTYPFMLKEDEVSMQQKFEFWKDLYYKKNLPLWYKTKKTWVPLPQNKKINFYGKRRRIVLQNIGLLRKYLNRGKYYWWNISNFKAVGNKIFHKHAFYPIPFYKFINQRLRVSIQEFLQPRLPIYLKAIRFTQRALACVDNLKKDVRFFNKYLKIIKKRAYRKERRWRFPTLTFFRNKSNLFYVLRDRYGQTFHISSIGTFGIKTRKKFDAFNTNKVAIDIADRYKLFHEYKIDVICRSPIRKGIQGVLWGSRKTGVQIVRLIDAIRMPHGHVRLSARQRKKRRKR